MQRFLNKIRPAFRFGRTFFRPAVPVQASNSRYQKSWHTSIYNRVSVTKTPQFFFARRQKKSTMEEDASEDFFSDSQEKDHKSSKTPTQEEVDNLPQSVCEDLSKEILSVITNDYNRLYNDKEISNTPLYRLLFQEGVNWNELITSPPQMRMVEGSPTTEMNKFCVFFPNSVTQEIFQICESVVDSAKILITAQQGLGKSYGLALYVYLKRKTPNCRVFFIHSSQAFIARPFSEFTKQFQVTFAEELKNPEIKKAYQRFGKTLAREKSEDNEKMNALEVQPVKAR